MRYFAYGANLDRQHMARLCPGARELGLARLPGHAFRIQRDGWATVVPAPDSTVYGLLWEIGPEDERALDYFEDVEDGLYRKMTSLVATDDGPAEAMVYVATDPTPGVPARDYAERIIAAMRAVRLPEDYVAPIVADAYRDGPSLR